MKCDWCLGFKEYEDYHDTEWGVPVFDDCVHFEFLVLESAQAGLSWATILKRRENYRRAYQGFDVKKVSEFTSEDVERLMQNQGIIRNRKKIEASINNAQRFLEVVEEYGSFSEYIWSFVGHQPIVNHFESIGDLPAKTDLSEKVSKALKKKGFKFLGPVIMYSHMQATGLINDHLISCERHQTCIDLWQSK